MLSKIIGFVIVSGLLIGLYAFSQNISAQTPGADPQMVKLAVRATVFAMPSPTAQRIEVTRMVEVTRIVEVTRVVLATPVPEPSPTITPTQTAIPTVIPTAEANSVSASALVVESAPPVAPAAPQVELPIEAITAVESVAGCPATSQTHYTSIPVLGAGLAHPDSLHGDLNLSLRGYVPVNAAALLVSINGPTDGDAPQIGGMFGDGRLPEFTRTYQVRDWNWSCGGHGCRGDEVGHVEVSMVGMRTTPGETISLPSRGAEIYGGGFKALVLYADSERVTFSYTRDDTVANGYVVHIEQLCVDPNLVARYRENNQAGRGTLPAVRNGKSIGVASGGEIAIAVRDRGSFTDPRSRKDWWKGY